MNNLPMEIANRNSLHMFKKGIKPRWEDPRNKDGGRFSATSADVGGWTFRVSQVHAKEFFQYIILLVIGESLTSHIDERRPLI
jgi:hypothetical protein